jgi:hypothetical protein
VWPGELFDKITPLENKSEYAHDTEERRSELATLVAVRDRSVFASAALSQLAAEMTAVHERLSTIEKELRNSQQARRVRPAVY